MAFIDGVTCPSFHFYFLDCFECVSGKLQECSKSTVNHDLLGFIALINTTKGEMSE